MKYEITPVNTTRRGLDSARYTVTRRDDLQLFSIVFICPDDPDFTSDPVEFWATSFDTAYDELRENVGVFKSYGLDSCSDTDQPFLAPRVVQWLAHYLRGQWIVTQGASQLEIIDQVVDLNNHCAYVLRKMCELVDQLDKAESFQGSPILRAGMHTQ